MASINMYDNKGYHGSKNDVCKYYSSNDDPNTSHSKPDEYTFEFEEGLNIVGYGSYNRWLVVILGMALLGVVMDMFGFALVVFGCSCDFQLTHQQKSILNSVPFAGPVFAVYLWGYVADTQGRRKTLVFSLGASALVSIISCFSPNWIVLAVTKYLSVALSCGSQATAYTLLGESCGEKKRRVFMIVLTCFLMVGQGCMYVMSYFILPLEFSYNMGILGSFLPWRLLALSLTIPLVLGFLGILMCFESPKFLLNQGRHEEALDVMKKMWLRNGGSSNTFHVKKITLIEENAATSSNSSLLISLWRQTVPLLKPPLLKYTLQLFYISAISYFITSGVVSWFPFVVDKFFMSLELEGEVSFCGLLGNKTSDTSTGKTDDLSETCATTFQDSTVVSAVAYSLFSLVANLGLTLIPGRKKLTIIVICIITAASGIGLLYTLDSVVSITLYIVFALVCVVIAPISSYYVELYPTSYRGMAACLGMVMARVSSLAGTNVFGAFVMTQCDFTFYGASAFALSAGSTCENGEIIRTIPENTELLESEVKTYEYEEALELVGHGAYNIKLFLLMCFILISMTNDMYSINTLIIGGDCEFLLTMSQKNILTFMPLIGPLVMAYPWGYISDTQGRRNSMVIALSLGCVFSTLSAFSRHWILLGVLKFFSTGFSSCAHSCTYTLLGESCIERLRGRYMLLMGSALTSVTLCINLLSYVILKPDYSIDMGALGLWTPWRSNAVAVAAPLGVGVLMLLCFNESPKFLLNVGREKQALEALRNIYERNGGRPDRYPVKQLILGEQQASLKSDVPLLKSLWEQVAPLFKPPLLCRTMQLYYVVATVYSSLSGFYMWYTYMVNAFFLTLRTSTEGEHGICDMILLASRESSSLNSSSALSHPSCFNKIEFNTALASLSQALAYVLLSLCVFKFSVWKRLMLMGLILAAAVGGFGVTITREPISAILLFLLFSMHGLTTGILSSYFVDLFPTSYRGMAACLSVIVARCSMLAASSVIGGHILTNCNTTFFVFSLFMISGVVVAWFLPSDKEKESTNSKKAQNP